MGLWQQLTDPATGAHYYLHTTSGVVQWEEPEWVDRNDDATGHIYYYNHKTGVSQWERPSNFVPIIRDATAGHAKRVDDPEEGALSTSNQNKCGEVEVPISDESCEVEDEVECIVEHHVTQRGAKRSVK